MLSVPTSCILKFMIRHVIWDWNGTLLNDVELCVFILNDLLAKNQRPAISLDQYRKTFFFPVAKFYKSLGLPSSGPDYYEMASTYIQAYRKKFKECSLTKDATEVAHILSDMGISQSVLSAGKQKDVENFVHHYDLSTWMTLISGASNIEAKGKEECAKKHIAKLPFEPYEVLLIGDTLHDLEVANLIGCEILLFSGGHVDKCRLDSVSKPVINSLTQILSRVRC